MIRLIFLFICAPFATISFGQQADTLLFNAYETKSLVKLKSFFEKWAENTPAISNEEFHLLNDTEKNVYQVFQSFYNPKDINKTGGSEWGNHIYKHVKYFLVQNKIYFAFEDTLPKNVDEIRMRSRSRKSLPYDSVKNFRPQLSFSKVKCVLVDKYHEALINQFLGNEHSKLGTGNIMSPAHSKDESENRQNFLEHYIKIWYGHWGGYWQLYSYPYASTIVFDRKLENAIVFYTMVYQGGCAFFSKNNNTWTLTDAALTWIE